MHTPSELLNFSKRTTSKGLVKIYVSCLLVIMCSRFITLSSTRSLMKWWWMLMCLVLLWWTWFFKILIALKLPQNNVMASCLTLYSFNICFIQSSWVQLLLAAMYSTSTVDNETQFCLLLNQEIIFLPIKKHPRDVLLLSSALLAQFASQYPTSVRFVSWKYNMP